MRILCRKDGNHLVGRNLFFPSLRGRTLGRTGAGRKFNVDLKMWNIMVDSSNMEQVQMMLAAGDVPDYGFYYTSGQYLYEQGLGRTIPLNMMKEYYPSLLQKLMEDPVDCNSTRYRIRKESITVLPPLLA